MFEEIYKKLLAYKSESELTWEEIAKESGISLSLLNKLSCGERKRVSLTTFEKLSAYLDKQKAA